EDAAQDFLVWLLENRHKFDPGRGNPQAWFTSVLSNQVTDRLRKKTPVQWPGPGAGEANPVGKLTADSPPPLEQLGNEERRQLVHQGMERLTEEERRLLEQRYVHGKKLREIGEENGMTTNKVSGRLTRVKKLLASILKSLFSSFNA